jgi:hypothetical protein
MLKGDGFFSAKHMNGAFLAQDIVASWKSCYILAKGMSFGYPGEYAMNESSKDAGLIAVLIKRFEEKRLPVALDLKKKVDRGEKLNDLDIAFLEKVFADAGEIKPLLDRHSEYHQLVVKTVSLYHEITEKALQNQGSD